MQRICLACGTNTYSRDYVSIGDMWVDSMQSLHILYKRLDHLCILVTVVKLVLQQPQEVGDNQNLFMFPTVESTVASSSCWPFPLELPQAFPTHLFVKLHLPPCRLFTAEQKLPVRERMCCFKTANFYPCYRNSLRSGPDFILQGHLPVPYQGPGPLLSSHF